MRVLVEFILEDMVQRDTVVSLMNSLVRDKSSSTAVGATYINFIYDSITDELMKDMMSVERSCMKLGIKLKISETE